MRLSWWLGVNLSMEMAILSMMILRDEPTATLCYGFIKGPNYDFVDYHAWVEYRRGTRWWVMDLFCENPCECLRSSYFGRNGYGRDIFRAWRCSSDVFWSIDTVEMIWALLHFPDTSYMMRELAEFRPQDYEFFSYKEWFEKECDLKFDSAHMVPFCFKDGSPRRPISTGIILDFVKKANRQQPKMKTLRKAMWEIKQNEKANH